MSRHDQLQPPTNDGAPTEPTADSVRLQIDLRLKLQEIMELEAEVLKAEANSRGQPTRRQLCTLACSIYEARRKRDRLFDQKLFGEPAWDMLDLDRLPMPGEMLVIFLCVTHQTYHIRRRFGGSEH